MNSCIIKLKGRKRKRKKHTFAFYRLPSLVWQEVNAFKSCTPTTLLTSFCQYNQQGQRMHKALINHQQGVIEGG